MRNYIIIGGSSGIGEGIVNLLEQEELVQNDNYSIEDASANPMEPVLKKK